MVNNGLLSVYCSVEAQLCSVGVFVCLYVVSIFVSIVAISEKRRPRLLKFLYEIDEYLLLLSEGPQIYFTYKQTNKKRE